MSSGDFFWGYFCCIPQWRELVQSWRAGNDGNSKTEAFAEFIKQRRGGGRVGLKEEWEDEDAVYDVIGEGEYASIVAKRREEGGQMHHQYTLHCMPGNV